ncbi:hypothetical protein [Lyngbya sp. CCY1209]|uniref:hypothetical protein n=1 Tax=Lyngbya sp. CCY1209 TaxID=2886103 RepID=UPI002D210D3E|nr:hypothetical protein [Lyngbya sp. CCY1209]MEB3886743.1 hypothetical protein [Lyngbya sp. CCY1209]
MPFSHLLIFDGTGRVRFGWVRLERGRGFVRSPPAAECGFSGRGTRSPGRNSERAIASKA